MGTHSKPRDRRVSVTKIAGLGGIAAAAATMAMSVGAGTAEANPVSPGVSPGGHTTTNPTNALSPGGHTTTNPVTNAATLSTIGSLGAIYNPGPITIGKVTNPVLKAPQQYLSQFIVTPAVPGSRPFASIQGFQLPFWTVNPTTGAPVPPF